ncbi:hypothetical protein G806_01970, partial [Escherichia coli HVH 148 (4-3192490)]
QKKLIMLPSETMIWQPEFTDKTLSRKPGAVHLDSDVGCYTYGIANVYGYPLCVLRNPQVITHTEQR